MQIIVREGTCGIAAGSKEVIEELLKLLPNTVIKSVGC